MQSSRDYIQARATSRSSLVTGTATPAPVYEKDHRPCARCGIVRRVHTERKRERSEYCAACRTQDGAAPVIADDPTPCYFNDEFFALENEVTETMDTEEFRASGRKRIELAASVNPIAEDQFCGHCPIKDACLAWGKAEEYTGIAGGMLLLDGIEVPTRLDPNIKQCRNGHDRTPENTITDSNGWKVCLLCKRSNYLRREEKRRAGAYDGRSKGGGA